MQVIENWEHLSPIQKAEFTLAYLQANGGQLPPEVRDRFLLQLIKDSDFLTRCSVINMKSDQYHLDSFRFGSRALHTASPGTALPQSQRTVPDLERQTLVAKLFKAEVEIEKEVFEDNIEQEALMETINSKIAERCKEDIVEIVINSDTSLLATDADLGQFNGFYASITSHTVAATGVPKLSKQLLESLIKVMPTEYRRPDKLICFTGTVPALDYIYSLGDRQTDMGDATFDRAFSARSPGGIMVLGEPEIRENLGVGSNESVAVLADPKNFHVGFHPRLEMDVDKDIRAGTVFVVLRVRFDAKWAWEDATAKLTGIAGS